MRSAFLPDFELTAVAGVPRLTPRIGYAVKGELAEAAAPDDRECCSRTVILSDGSCVSATARVFRAADMAAQPSAVPGIFVYGTLMRGEELGHVLSGHGLVDVQPATVQGQLRHLGDYPGLLLNAGSGIVHGEFAVPADISAVLPELDEIECARPQGEPGGLYRRTLVMARLGDGRERRAWVYVIDDPGTHPIIRGGKWRERSRSG